MDLLHSHVENPLRMERGPAMLRESKRPTHACLRGGAYFAVQMLESVLLLWQYLELSCDEPQTFQQCLWSSYDVGTRLVLETVLC